MQTTERVSLGIRKNDTVQVIAGRERGKTGKVLTVNRKDSRITIEKLNIRTKFARPTQKNPQGGTIQKEMPIHISNVQLLCAKCNRGVRFGIKVSGDKKVRVCKRCDAALDQG